MEDKHLAPLSSVFPLDFLLTLWVWPFFALVLMPLNKNAYWYSSFQKLKVLTFSLPTLHLPCCSHWHACRPLTQERMEPCSATALRSDNDILKGIFRLHTYDVTTFHFSLLHVDFLFCVLPLKSKCSVLYKWKHLHLWKWIKIFKKIKVFNTSLLN